MKNRIFTLGVMALLFTACAVNELDTASPAAKDAEEFLATIEDASTKVHVDEKLRVLWNADDRVSIFNKYTYNQQYRFNGEDGDNSGAFKKVPNDDFVTGNALDLVYSVYPYQESTTITNDGEITVVLPAEQTYREDSFGLGANTMVSCSEGNELLFKNLCGYIVLKLYGDNVTVKSISIKGNNDEPLAGKATVNAYVDNAPSLTFDASATKEITLSFDTPVTIGSTAETATTIWLVVPPTTFSKGITLTVKDDKNGEFKKSTSASLQISRNILKRMSSLEVEVDHTQPNNVIYYTSRDDSIVMPYDPNQFNANLVSNEYVNGQGVIRFDSDVTKIGYRAFRNCSNLTSIAIPGSVRSIQTYAFAGCSSLISITIPNSVTSIGYEAFSDCSSLADIKIPNSVTSLGDYVFYRCSGLVSITIPNSVTSIGKDAFSDCSSLTSITIPNSITGILEYTFSRCSSLSSIIFPDSVKSIGNGVFLNCTSLTSITIGNGVISIGNWAFSGCSNLASVIIPNSVISIGDSAFSGCSSLTSVTIPDSVSSVGIRAFEDCSSLKNFNGKYASLDGHFLLKQGIVIAVASGAIDDSIIIPDGVIGIGGWAFYHCTNLKTITIPNSVTSIEEHAFNNCSNLASVSIPDSVISICGSAFDYCTSLASITIPNSVTNLGELAFSRCLSLSSITIPDRVTSVGDYAFSSCTGLNSITVKSLTPPAGGSSMFLNTNNCPIYVPAGSVEAYKAAENWSDYANRIQSLAPLPEAVDLGLPSGLKWASFNLGASKPEETGGYYAWGEAETKTRPEYNWEYYKFCMGDDKSFTKYCNNSEYGYNGYVDNLSTLESEDDVAHAKLGNHWRIPTWQEVMELQQQCEWTWATQDGTNGYLVKSQINDNRIFIPACGQGQIAESVIVGGINKEGRYWTSSLSQGYPQFSTILVFDSNEVKQLSSNMLHSQRRSHGLTIRPVSD